MKSVFAIIASAAVAIAQAVGELAINDFPIEGAVAGSSYTITYTAPDQTAPVTFLLRAGDAGDLKTLATLTTSAVGGTFVWNVDSTLADRIDYAVEIVQGPYNNYMGPFPISGGSGSTASTTATTASSSATASSSVTTTVSSSAPYGTGVTTARPNGTGTVGTLSPSSTGNTKPTSTGTDDEPAPFEGAASGVSVSFAGVAAVFGLVALLA